MINTRRIVYINNASNSAILTEYLRNKIRNHPVSDTDGVYSGQELIILLFGTHMG